MIPVVGTTPVVVDLNHRDVVRRDAFGHLQALAQPLDRLQAAVELLLLAIDAQLDHRFLLRKNEPVKRIMSGQGLRAKPFSRSLPAA